MDKLTLILIFSALTGINCEELTPVKDEVISPEDSSITLSYTYHKTISSGEEFYWYQQHPGKPPEFLFYISGANFSRAAETLGSDTKFSTKFFQENRLDLQISSAALSDSAVYYCAVRPAGSSPYKIIFGRGTKLHVISKTPVEPSFYKLDSDDKSVCLATGFTNHTVVNETARSLFDGTEAFRAKGESGYSQVAPLTKDEEKKECEERETGAPCGDALKPDPLVNLMSLTVVGLRLIFIKTIIFNVLMTLRLWISH